MAKIPWEIHQARFIASAVKTKQFPTPALPQVAFAGRSNVGKSSLLNMLVRMTSLARTSRTPGLTQLINFFLINETFYFVDLPGYGFAKVPPSVHKGWQAMIENYLANNPDLRLLILLLDSRHEPTKLDDQMVDYVSHYGIPTLLVLTKSDKLTKTALIKSQKKFAAHYGLTEDNPALPVSAEKGTGREELLKIIYEAVTEESTVDGD